MTFGLQFACASLIGIGLVFIWIETRTHFDRTFLIFGAALIFLCLVIGIDLWIIPHASLAELNTAIRVFHILACVYASFTIWYLMLLVNNFHRKTLAIFGSISAVFCIAFATPVFLTIRNNDVVATPLYSIAFFPFVLAFALLAIIINTRGILLAQGMQRRILLLHLVGFAAMMLFALIDVVIMATIGSNKLPIPSFLMLGAIVFGAMATAIFTERFRLLLSERASNHTKLQQAYSELEKVSSLKEIGTSAAMVGHEIRNFMTQITANAQLISNKPGLDQETISEAEAIIEGAHALETFSDDMLSLTKVHVFKDSETIDLSRIIADTLKSNFSHCAQLFDISGVEKAIYIRGEADKLKQAFANLFGNALDAGAADQPPIRIHTVANADIVVVVIDDNGRGCEEEILKDMFTAFYSTKKGRGGTGLGMSIVRTIVEGHGGRISAYSKNLLGINAHGMQFHIAFPRYCEPVTKDAERQRRVVLMNRQLAGIEEIMRILQNAAIMPDVIDSHQHISDVSYPLQNTIILSGHEGIDTIASLRPRCAGIYNIASTGPHFTIRDIDKNAPQNEPQLLCESYAVENLA